MKKNIFVLVLAALMCCAVLISGCSEKEPFVFSEDVMTLSDGTQIPIGSHFELDSDDALISGPSKETTFIDSSVSLNGIKLGSSASDFINAFCLTKNHAIWETYIIKSPQETIVNYENFVGKEISYASYDDRFISVGFVIEGDGTWSTMDYDTLVKVFDYRTYFADTRKVAAISAGLDSKGTITMLVVDYGEYSDFAKYYGKQTDN